MDSDSVLFLISKELQLMSWSQIRSPTWLIVLQGTGLGQHDACETAMLRHWVQPDRRGDMTQNWLYFYSAFLTSGYSKRFTVVSNIHPSIHVFTHRRRYQPCKGTASSSGAVRGSCLAQGHLDTRRLGGAGDRTSNLPVTSQPAPPHETHADTCRHMPPPEKYNKTHVYI